MSENDSVRQIQRHLDGIATPEEVAALSGQLESDSETRRLYLRLAGIHAALSANGVEDAESELDGADSVRIAPSLPGNAKARGTPWWWLAGEVAALVLLIVGLFVFLPPDPEIVTVVRTEGSVRWTGDGGQVDRHLAAGRKLHGGTLECLTLDASVKLRFRDGSTATLSGISALTISDREQKEWHLRQGSLTASVPPQPAGKPLRVYTPAATLEVLGTQFDVTAEAARTVLTVREGRVRLEQLTDHHIVEVPAGHRTVASVEGRDALQVIPLLRATRVWRADLQKDVDSGEWYSAMVACRLQLSSAVDRGEITPEDARRRFFAEFPNPREDVGSVRAEPARVGPSGGVNYLVGLDVARRAAGPVAFTRGSRFRVRGKVRVAAEILVGFTAVDQDRTERSKYGTSRKVAPGKFDIVLPLAAFHLLDGKMKPEPGPGLELLYWFCLTEKREAGLEITAVELLGPE